MTRRFLLAMSLLSLLFGCNTKKTPAKPEEYPRFPETDQPTAQVVPVPLDSGYSVKSFFIAPDRQHVYVLGYRPIIPAMEEGEVLDPNERDMAACRLYHLGDKGQVKHHLDLPPQKTYGYGSFGLLNDQLLLRFGDHFLVLDTQKIAIQERIPVYDEQFFPSKKKVGLMTPDEQRDAYQPLFEALLQQAAACKWLDWTPGGEYLVFVQGPAGKRSAWAPISYEDDLLVGLKSRLEPLLVKVNPQAGNDGPAENFQCTDGSVHIREVEYLSAVTELDYPNYKNRRVLQYEMTVGSKTLHFSTSDKKRHDLRLGLADNLLLATVDGTGWVKYEGVLYRIEE